VNTNTNSETQKLIVLLHCNIAVFTLSYVKYWSWTYLTHLTIIYYIRIR